MLSNWPNISLICKNRRTGSYVVSKFLSNLKHSTNTTIQLFNKNKFNNVVSVWYKFVESDFDRTDKLNKINYCSRIYNLKMYRRDFNKINFLFNNNNSKKNNFTMVNNFYYSNGSLKNLKLSNFILFKNNILLLFFTKYNYYLMLNNGVFNFKIMSLFLNYKSCFLKKTTPFFLKKNNVIVKTNLKNL